MCPKWTPSRKALVTLVVDKQPLAVVPASQVDPQPKGIGDVRAASILISTIFCPKWTPSRKALVTACGRLPGNLKVSRPKWTPSRKALVTASYVQLSSILSEVPSGPPAERHW